MCLFTCLGVIQGWGWHVADQYEYKTKVTVNPTGKGTVYVNYTANDEDNSNNTTNTVKEYSATVFAGSNTTTISLNASPIEGYRFLRWQDENGNTFLVILDSGFSEEVNNNYYRR